MFVLFLNIECKFKRGQFLECRGTLRKTQGDSDTVDPIIQKAVLKRQD